MSRSPRTGRARRTLVSVLTLATVTWLLPALPALGTPPDTRVREVALSDWTTPPTGLTAMAAGASSGSIARSERRPDLGGRWPHHQGP